MSETNYQNMRRYGVTGSETNTCLVAGCDRSHPFGGVPKAVYEEYQEFEPWYNALSAPERANYSPDYEALLNRIFKPLAGVTCRRVLFHSAENERDFIATTRRWMRLGRCVVVDIDWEGTPHSLGLVPSTNPELVWAGSTYKPRELYGFVSLKQIYQFGLNTPEALPDSTTYYDPERYPFNDANMMGIPLAA